MWKREGVRGARRLNLLLIFNVWLWCAFCFKNKYWKKRNILRAGVIEMVYVILYTMMASLSHRLIKLYLNLNKLNLLCPARFLLRCPCVYPSNFSKRKKISTNCQLLDIGDQMFVFSVIYWSIYSHRWSYITLARSSSMREVDNFHRSWSCCMCRVSACLIFPPVLIKTFGNYLV